MIFARRIDDLDQSLGEVDLSPELTRPSSWRNVRSSQSVSIGSLRTARMMRFEAVGCDFSSGENSTSWSFSPARTPVNSIGDVLLRLASGQPDHVLGQVDDADRIAHVEHEDVAAGVAGVGGADDQLDRSGWS